MRPRRPSLRRRTTLPPSEAPPVPGAAAHPAALETLASHASST
jgi:hypothetical protein